MLSPSATQRSLAVLLAIALFLSVEPARAAIVVTVFPVSSYDADTAAMDAALGITGYTVEGFETLNPFAGGLSVTFSGFVGSGNIPSGTPDRTITSLPNLFDATNVVGHGDNTWDGTHALVNSSGGDNVFDTLADANPPTATLTTFAVAGGTTSFGVGLANFQPLGSPVAPITDHDLFVNGVSFGTIESLGGGQFSGGLERNAYVRIDATGGEVIMSVGFRNNGGPVADKLIFDHVAFGPAAVPEPASAITLAVGAAGLAAVRRGRRA